MRILADTNILLRLAEPTHAQYVPSDTATEFLRSLGHELVIVPQNLVEFWAVATRPLAQNGLAMNTSEAEAMLLRMQRLFHLLRDENSIFEFWKHSLLLMK